MTKSNEPQTSFGTIGQASRAVVASSSTGQQPSATASGKPLTVSAVLATMRPEDTERRVADALQRISGSRPVIRKRNFFPESGPAYSVPESCSWTCSDEKRLEALTVVDGSLRAAPEQEIVKALFELRTLTRGRVNRDPSEDEAEAIIWTERLRSFPADIVLDTLRNWPNRSDGQWWPTWHDVHKIVEAETSARRMLADHIRSGACLPKPAAEELDRDDSPEGVAYRKAVTERHMAKLKREEEEARWKPREAGDIARQMRSENLALSSEALAIFRSELAEKARPSPDEEFENWNKGRSAA